MLSIDFIALCESVIEESLLSEARTTYYRRIADEAAQAREIRQTTNDSDAKSEALDKLKTLQTEMLGELNYGTRAEYKIATNDELEAILHELSIKQSPLNLSGMAHLKPSVLGDVSELKPRTESNAWALLLGKLKSKGKDIFQILYNKQKTGRYE